MSVGRIAGCALLVWGAACDSSDAEPASAIHATNVEADRAETLIGGESPAVVLDVRTPEEFGGGHIAGAQNLNITGDGFDEGLGELDRERAYVVHCAAGAAGGRSERAVERMHELGFTDVYHLVGGFNAWSAAGKPVAR